MKLALSLLHEEDEARDVVQEVFLKIMESDISIDRPLPFIMRAVRNASLNRIRMLDTRGKIRQRLSLEPPPEEEDIPENNDEEILSAMRRLLSAREQETIEKIYSDGMSYKEAAGCLGVSVAAINKNVVTALRKLRNHFKTGKS